MPSIHFIVFPVFILQVYLSCIPCLCLSLKKRGGRGLNSPELGAIYGCRPSGAVRWKVERSGEERSNKGCCNGSEWDLLSELCASQRPCMLHRHSAVSHSFLCFTQSLLPVLSLAVKSSTKFGAFSHRSKEICSV